MMFLKRFVFVRSSLCRFQLGERIFDQLLIMRHVRLQPVDLRYSMRLWKLLRASIWSGVVIVFWFARRFMPCFQPVDRRCNFGFLKERMPQGSQFALFFVRTVILLKSSCD